MSLYSVSRIDKNHGHWGRIGEGPRETKIPRGIGVLLHHYQFRISDYQRKAGVKYAMLIS